MDWRSGMIGAETVAGGALADDVDRPDEVMEGTGRDRLMGEAADGVASVTVQAAEAGISQEHEGLVVR
jgi:hypothetical protein